MLHVHFSKLGLCRLLVVKMLAWRDEFLLVLVYVPLDGLVFNGPHGLMMSVCKENKNIVRLCKRLCKEGRVGMRAWCLRSCIGKQCSV